MTYSFNGKHYKQCTILGFYSSVEDLHFLGYNMVSTENGDHRLLQNVGIQLPIGITLYPRRPESSTPQTVYILWPFTYRMNKVYGKRIGIMFRPRKSADCCQDCIWSLIQQFQILGVIRQFKKITTLNRVLCQPVKVDNKLHFQEWIMNNDQGLTKVHSSTSYRNIMKHSSKNDDKIWC